MENKNNRLTIDKMEELIWEGFKNDELSLQECARLHGIAERMLEGKKIVRVKDKNGVFSGEFVVDDHEDKE